LLNWALDDEEAGTKALAEPNFMPFRLEKLKG